MSGTLLMISDAKAFWSAQEISDTTQIAAVDRKGEIQITYPNLDHLTMKRVVVLMHGYNDASQDVLQNYFLMKEQLEKLRGEHQPLYDVVVGYQAPLYDHKLDYFAAETNAKKLAPRVKQHFQKLSAVAASVDVIAHSMGNRLAFEALQGEENRVYWIKHFFSLAPAVNSSSVENGHPFFQSLNKCREVAILYSKRDEMLGKVYPIAEWSEALGYAGVEKAKKLPENTQQVDCTEIVGGHSEYMNAPGVYAFIRGRVLDEIVSPGEAQRLKILANGTVEEMRLKKSDYGIAKVGGIAMLFVLGFGCLYSFWKYARG